MLVVATARTGSAQDRIRAEPSGPANPWTTTTLARDSAAFRFVIFCDRAGDLRPGVFEQAVAKANLLKPDLAVCVGDLIVGCEDSAEVERQWDEFDGIVRGLEMPFFYVPGNHVFHIHQVANNFFTDTYSHWIVDGARFEKVERFIADINSPLDVRNRYICSYSSVKWITYNNSKEAVISEILMDGVIWLLTDFQKFYNVDGHSQSLRQYRENLLAS